MNTSEADAPVKKQKPLTPRQIEEIFEFPANLLPRHVAVIPDGNGRWAKLRDQSRIMGHREGINAVRRTVRESRRLGISYLTVYAFSNENWSRPEQEVSALWQLLKTYIREELSELFSNGVRLKVIGRYERLPKDVRQEVDRAIERTRNNTDMVLTIALSYSGRDELVHAARRFAHDVADGKLEIDQLDEKRFSNYLETAGLPDPDLLIRTSGERRISNYLLWQLAYAEIYTLDTLWPDFSVEHYHNALKDYVGRERRFGRTSEQL